ncbi:nucleotidyltransferase family protein [Pontibacter beigongshangensis]|uniref:nucleotidyltransferase family protein n=1 Tax=Pontibacter beigongshangensis TaxID=2574733 RepID=UPI001650A37D|nr:nucleotidyltransferase family protein [Pontibacter beigongshangensis]
MTGLVLLAAGASTRLGEPKQNLLFEGQRLIQRAAEAALASACSPVVVVLGANASLVQPELTAPGLSVVTNPEWAQGMGASIRCGLLALLTEAPAAAACLLMVCDQPYVSSSLLNRLLEAKAENRAGMVASAYGNIAGTPALFDKKYFPELLALNGEEGARKLLLAHMHDVVTVPFPQGAIDVDTAADYAGLLRSSTST